MNIVEYISPFRANRAEMSEVQKTCFDKIERRLDNCEYVDVGGYNSYIFAYMSRKLDSVWKVKHADILLPRFENIKKHYKYEVLYNYASIWFKDLLLLKGDYQGALDSFTVLDPRKIYTMHANSVLNIKFHLGINISPVELLCINNNITKTGQSYFNEILEYSEMLLKRHRETKGEDFLKFIGDKYNELRVHELQVFSGYMDYLGGRDFNAGTLSELYYKQPYAIKAFEFYKIKEFNDFSLEVCRDAENAVREDKGLPKVGEGWVSETELYYLVKYRYSDVDVIIHYTDDWLGGQHLDIFIRDLNIAFEYQGRQHFEPVEFFGGEEAFKEVQKRDKEKKEKCKKKGIRLFYVLENYDINEVFGIIEKVIKGNC